MGLARGAADYNSRVAGIVGASMSNILLQGGQQRPRSHYSCVRLAMGAISGRLDTGGGHLGRLATGIWSHSLSHWPG